MRSKHALAALLAMALSACGGGGGGGGTPSIASGAGQPSASGGPQGTTGGSSLGTRTDAETRSGVGAGDPMPAYDAYARRFDANAAAIGSEFKLNASPSQSCVAPLVAGLAGGGFVATWTMDAGVPRTSPSRP